MMSGISLMLVFGCLAVIIVAGIAGVLLFVLRRSFTQGGHGNDHTTDSSSGGWFAWGGSDSGNDGGFWGGDSSGDSGGGDSGGDGGGE
jgi:hypothetical protein